MSTSPVELSEEDLAQFEWLNLHKEMDEVAPQETKLEKLIRKTNENPFVPLGITATTAALIYGVWNFKVGRRKMSQYMMRTRVAAQGFTLFAVVAGYIFGLDRK